MRALITLLLSLITLTAHAAGPDDGIYTVTTDGQPPGFASVHQSGNEVVVVILDVDSMTWEAVTGARAGNVAELSLVLPESGGEVPITLQFMGAGAAQITFGECTPPPGQECFVGPDVVWTLQRAF